MTLEYWREYRTYFPKRTSLSQIILNQKNGEIVCTAHGKGREHDFKLYKRSRISLLKGVECLADKGYQGIQKFHAFSQMSKKKPLLW